MNIHAPFEFLSTRNLLALGIAFSLGATITHGSAQTLFSDNFSSYGTPGASGVGITTGSPLPSGSSYTGGGLVFNSGTATGTDALAAAAFGGGSTNNFGKAGIGATNNNTNETTQWNLASNSPTNGTLTLTFDFYYVTTTPDQNKAVQFNFYDQPLNKNSFAEGRGLGLFLKNDGTVGTYTGSAEGPDLVGTFQMDTLQTFSVTFNFATNSYTASIGGASGSGTFLASRDWLKTVWINDSASNNVNFYYDNVVIAVPEPGTVFLALGGLAVMVIAARVRRSKLA